MALEHPRTTRCAHTGHLWSPTQAYAEGRRKLQVALATYTTATGQHRIHTLHTRGARSCRSVNLSPPSVQLPATGLLGRPCCPAEATTYRTREAWWQLISS